MNIKYKHLKEIARSINSECGLEVRVHPKYSGRGMYGEDCVGFVTGNPYLFMYELGRLMKKVEDESHEFEEEFNMDVREFVEKFSSPSTDSMGRSSTILYFHEVKCNDASSTEDDNDE